METFYCKVYKDYKISIPSKIRKLLSINSKDEIVLKINDKNQVVLDTVQHELSLIQQDIKDFFKGHSISSEFLKNRGKDYDDN